MTTSSNGQFEWDVFLSPSSEDKPRVARRAERRNQAGFPLRFAGPKPTPAGGRTGLRRGLRRARRHPDGE